MKYILLVLMFPLVASAQKGYGIATLHYGANKDIKSSIGATLSFGGKINMIALGGGVGFYKLQNIPKIYIPLFIEVAAIPVKRKIAPIGSLRAGYGLYSSAVSVSQFTQTTKGGFYGSAFAGVSFPLKGITSFFIAGGVDLINLTVTSNLYGDFNGSRNHQLLTGRIGVTF